jgi:hypothetical protein
VKYRDFYIGGAREKKDTLQTLFSSPRQELNMALKKNVGIFLLFVSTMLYSSFSFKCERLDNRFQKLCSTMNASYNFTASFPTFNGVRYQEKVYMKVIRLQSLLKACSSVSNVMVCSRYLPKCSVEGPQNNPVLPCREVCEQFVEQCEGKLKDNNLKLLYSTLCTILPEGKLGSIKCIKPKGFERQPNAKKIGKYIS